MRTQPLSSVFDKLDKEESEKLSMIISRLLGGNENIIETPISQRVGSESIFKGWSDIFNSNLSRINEDLFTLEEAQREKFGPRSRALPWNDISASVLQSFEFDMDISIPSGDILTPTRAWGRLRPSSMAAVIDSVKPKTNSGLPYLTKKRDVLDKTINNLKEDFSNDWPCVPFIRTQENFKTRLVQAPPLSDILEETKIFLPSFKIIRELEQFAGMRSPEAVDTAVTNLLFRAVGSDLKCLSGDISSFDQDFHPDLSRWCYKQIALLFQPNYRQSVVDIGDRMINKGLIIPEGVINSGLLGGPLKSGSMFTNLVGSIGNFGVSKIPPMFGQFLGDDFICITNHPEKVFQNYRDAGFKINEDKSYIRASSFVYLQKLYNRDYMHNNEVKGVYPTFRALNRLCYPERFSEFTDYEINGKDYFNIRSLSILENCRYHPLFKEFVTYWRGLNKYSLIPSNSSIINYTKMFNEREGSLGTVNQYGDAISASGIRNWESYKLAEKLG